MSSPSATPLPRIAVIGSANTDLVVRVASLPRPGETVVGGEFSKVGGGKGANQAVAAARAGGRVAFVAKVGDDDLGEAAITSYQAEGIDTQQVTRSPGTASGVALILIDAAGENAIAVASGANSSLSPADIETASAVIEDADIVLVQLEIPLDAVQSAVELAAAAGRRVILNPAPAQPLSDELFTQLAVLTPNETEATLLTGIEVHDVESAKEAASCLLARGVPAVIITLGSQGCVVAQANDTADPIHLPGHQVAAIDTVAAGDVFNGALAVALAEGRGLLDAAAIASAAAAIAVTRPGAQSSAPHRDEIDSLLDRSLGR